MDAGKILHKGFGLRRHIRIRNTTLFRWISPFFDPLQFFQAFPRYLSFLEDLKRYSTLEDAEQIRFADTYPCIHDKTPFTNFDAHYFYQDIWAFKKISQSKVKQHVDVGSRVDFVGFLTAITEVAFVDIRPLLAALENLYSKKGSILSMPFPDNSLSSLSCLHVAEHVGLGRYGDSLDPLGTQKACGELARTLIKGGSLYFSLPVGKPRLCFNAHRIHSPRQIIKYFANLELVEFSGIDDKGNFRSNISTSALENSDYACGLFHFAKR